MDVPVAKSSTRSCEVDTPCGRVLVEGPVAPAALASYTMNGLMNNFRPADRQKEALVEIAGLDPGLVFVARHDNEIVGYVTFHRPDEHTRWIKHPRVLELGGIEVSREWRKARLGRRLLECAFSCPLLEDYIVITTEYCWHWDLRGTGLDIWDYRKMLTSLFGAAGMTTRATDDPDICEHPANVLMARVGANVPPRDVLIFEEMLFEEKRFY